MSSSATNRYDTLFANADESQVAGSFYTEDASNASVIKSSEEKALSNLSELDVSRWRAREPGEPTVISVPASATDKILKEVSAVVFEVGEASVRIKLDGDLFVNFPKIVFSDPSILQYGRTISYSIRETPEKLRYQHFEAKLPTRRNSYAQQIAVVLGSIRTDDDET